MKLGKFVEKKEMETSRKSSTHYIENHFIHILSPKT